MSARRRDTNQKHNFIYINSRRSILRFHSTRDLNLNLFDIGILLYLDAQLQCGAGKLWGALVGLSAPSKYLLSTKSGLTAQCAMLAPRFLPSAAGGGVARPPGGTREKTI